MKINKYLSLSALFTSVYLLSPTWGMAALSNAEIMLNWYIFTEKYLSGKFSENIARSQCYPSLSFPAAPLFHYYNPGSEMPVVYATQLATLPQALNGLPKDITPTTTDIFFVVQAYYMEPGSPDYRTGSGNFCFRPQHWLAPEGTFSLKDKWSIVWDLTCKVFPANKNAEGLKLSHESISVSFHDSLLSGNAPYLTNFQFNEKKVLLFWTLTTDNEKTTNNTKLPNKKPETKKHALTLHAFVTPEVFSQVQEIVDKKHDYFDAFKACLEREYSTIIQLEKFDPAIHQTQASVPQPSKPAEKVTILEFSKSPAFTIEALQEIILRLSNYARSH